MQPTHSVQSRPSYKLKSINLPFYTLPQTKKNSAKIIQEARASIRALDTKRPFTPKDEQRTFFSHTSRPPDSRPPSTFSLNTNDFQKSHSRPESDTHTTVPEPISKGNDLPFPFLPKLCKETTPKSKKSLRTKLTDLGIAGLPHDPRHKKVIRRSSEELSKADLDGRELKRKVENGLKEKTAIFQNEKISKTSHNRRSLSLDSSMEAQKNNSTQCRDVKHSNEKSRQISEGLPYVRSAKIKNEALTEEILYYQELVVPVLADMDPKFKKEKNPELFCEASNKLYQALEDGNLLGHNCNQRATILKTIYKLLDIDSGDLLLRLARIVLSLRVSGKNLVNLMKLIFRVSRNEENDLLFLKDNVLELLLETLKSLHPLQNAEALVYGMGALKFLSGNPSLLHELSKLGCVEVLMHPLVQINRLRIDQDEADLQLGNILVQITATLRNLADSPLNRELFLCNRVVPELCRLLEHFSTDPDLMLNVSRIFSKLTLYSDCCYELARCITCYKAFLEVMRKHLNQEDVVVRICFILGNLTAKSAEARLLLFSELHTLDTLLNVFRVYFNVCQKSGEQNNKENQLAQKKTEDVLIKLIRVIANLCIHPDIGPVIASNKSCLILLLQILDSHDINKSEELVLNTIGTINNLSFYQAKNSAVTELQLEIVEKLLKVMVNDYIEGLIEASRVLGNLSRSQIVRDFLVKRKVCERMISLLDAGNQELIYTACGVLINLMADQDKHYILKAEDGISKLLDVLKDFGQRDWQLASLVCQVLWNYSINMKNTFEIFGEKQSRELMELLVDFTDEEIAFNTSNTLNLDESLKEIEKELWEAEFCPVATTMLEHLEKHLSETQTLDAKTH